MADIDHALAAYGYFHGRECLPMELTRFLEHDIHLFPEDHLLAIKIDDVLRLIGVVADGVTIVDTSWGDPTWGIQKSQARALARGKPLRRMAHVP